MKLCSAAQQSPEQNFFCYSTLWGIYEIGTTIAQIDCEYLQYVEDFLDIISIRLREDYLLLAKKEPDVFLSATLLLGIQNFRYSKTVVVSVVPHAPSHDEYAFLNTSVT